MTNKDDRQQCQYICQRKQRQCKMFVSTSLSTHCMEHLLHDPDLDEVNRMNCSLVHSSCKYNEIETQTNIDMDRVCSRQQNYRYVFHVQSIQLIR
jgi:hypothetical protein